MDTQRLKLKFCNILSKEVAFNDPDIYEFISEFLRTLGLDDGYNYIIKLYESNDKICPKTSYDIKSGMPYLIASNGESDEYIINLINSSNTIKGGIRFNKQNNNIWKIDIFNKNELISSDYIQENSLDKIINIIQEKLLNN